MTVTVGSVPAGPLPERAQGTGRLLAVNVGMPKDVPWQGKTVYTGVWKYPVSGPTMVRRLNIDGDGQGDTAGHGGEQRAVLVYQVQSYWYWQQHFGRNDFTYGQFGENLTVDGLPDDEVCIGDRYRIGEAEFEVTQPRVTCFRVGMRLGEPQLPALLVSHHRPGFYMRVVHEGHVQAGDEIVKTTSGPGDLSVAETDALLYFPGHDPAKLRVAVQIPALSPGWQQSFHDLLAGDKGEGLVAEAGPPVPPAWSGFQPLRVTKVVPEAPTVESIYLAAPDGSALPAAIAGQYITVRVTGAGQPAPVRSYSLSSAPGDGTYRISVKREPDGVASTYLTKELRPGSTLEVAAARGEFVLDPGTNALLLISAGIGITPVLAMLQQLAAERSDRDTWWIHGARRPEDDALATEAQALLAALPKAHGMIFYSAATPDEALPAHGSPGRITKEKLSHLALPADAAAYICGPSGFMTDIQEALTALGIDPLPHPNGAVRRAGIGQPGRRRPGPALAAPSSGPARYWAAGHFRPERHLNTVRHRLQERARAGRRLRHQHPLELSYRRVPHVYDAAAGRDDLLQSRPARAPRRGRGTYLLRPAGDRSGPRHVSHGRW